MGNRLKRPLLDEKTLMVNEIFYSVQGESSHAGKPCVFIRLTYCNLRCSYCDTEYAFYEGSPHSVETILQKVDAYHCPTVEVTGGEPLLQPAVFLLMEALCNYGYTVLLETSGSISLEKVDHRVIKIVDFKCPSSGMMHRNDEQNIRFLLAHDEIKFVIGSPEDYHWSVDFLYRTNCHNKVAAVLFSPVFGQMEPLTLVNWILQDKLQVRIPNIRFQVQMHKFIWPPETRGV